MLQWKPNEALPLMTCRLPMIHQNSLRFYKDWAVNKDYNGLVLTQSAGDAAFVSCVSSVLGAHRFELCRRPQHL